MSEVKVLAINLSEKALGLVSSIAKPDSFHNISSEEQFASEFEGFQDGQFSVVICEMTAPGSFAVEVGQVLRNQCPQTPSYCVTQDTSIYQPKILKKNGYTDSFLIPLEQKRFVELVGASLSPEALAKRQYKRVLAPDLKGESQLGFATFVFLPLNNKYIQYSGKNEQFSTKKVEKLKEHQVGNLFIDQKESNSFFEYVATQFKNLDNGMSETEREEKLHDSVRNILQDVFDQKSEASFDTGRDLLDSCRKLVSTYITGKGDTDFYSRLLKTIGGQRLDFSHSADVSTLAAMFGFACGSKSVEELAIAGFFHDLALAQFPEEYDYEVNPAWSNELKDQFLKHPQQSLNLVKTKKVILPADAEKMILQHHEKFAGGGFPKGLSGDRILFEAQILSFADQFHYLTTVKEGREKMMPLTALEIIAKNGSVTMEITNKVRKLMKGS